MAGRACHGVPVEQVDEHFLAAAARLTAAPNRRELDLTAAQALVLFDAQLGSRHLDLAARALRAKGVGFYTIGSAGHEGNAAVAAALRPTDPALLHYRSGAFYLARAAQVAGSKPLRDVLLGLVAAAEEPIAGGRHKVFGHPALAVIPQTSTIASHLPRALGAAFAIDRARKIGCPSPWPADAVVVCSFGDASANHSTAAGAINAAIQIGFRRLPLPLLLVCEDNGIGISVPTPEGWVAHAYGQRPGLRYFAADGCDLADAVATAARAAEWVRAHRRPALLHLRTVRLMGHAGSDVETAYRRGEDIAADLGCDPLLGTARLLVDAGILTPAQVLARYEDTREAVLEMAAEVAGAPQLGSAAEVMAPLAPADPDAVAAAAARLTPARPAPGPKEHLTLAQSINQALLDVLTTRPGALLFGEDVAVKGGVYGVTRGLLKKIGPARVFDTLLDEQTVLGLALGAGLSGLLPIPEIQYLAYLHNAEDQLRGEAATLQFFSNGQYRNPMVVRVAGFGYQRGFGGHFHNDDAVGVLRDIPGIVIASPGRPDDAAAMLRTCVAAAEVHGAVCVFLEPIARYHTRDLLHRRRQPVARPVPDGARTGRPGSQLQRRHRPVPGQLGQRAVPEPAGGGPPGRRRHPVPGGRPALAGPVADRGRAAGGEHVRPGAGGGRDTAQRWCFRGCARRVGRRRVHRADGPGHQQGQLHPARRRRIAHPGLRGRDRGGGPQAGRRRAPIRPPEVRLALGPELITVLFRHAECG